MPVTEKKNLSYKSNCINTAVVLLIAVIFVVSAFTGAVSATTYYISESNSNKAYHTGDGLTQGEFVDIGNNTPLPPEDEQYSEHNITEYSNIEADDGNKNSWESYNLSDDDYPEYNWINLWYNFTINEVASSIVGMQVLWNGYDELSDGGDFEFDIWNYTSNSWEIINQTNSSETSDQTYIETITSGISNYISPDGYLYLGISGARVRNTGSGCAFVYSYDGEKYYPEHAISDFAVHKWWEYPTYGLLPHMEKQGNYWNFAVWERVPETQYLDTLQLWKIIHNDTVEVIPEQTTGIIHTISEKEYPTKVIGTDNNSYLSEVTSQDDNYWVTNISTVNMSKPPMWDSLDLSFASNTSESNNVKLVVRGKDTGFLSEAWRSMVTAVEGNTKDYDLLNNNMSIFENVSDWVINNGLLYIYQKIKGTYQYIDSIMFGNAEFYHTWSLTLNETDGEDIELRFVGAPYAHQIDEVYIDRTSDESVEIIKMDVNITSSNKDNINDIEDKLANRDYDYFEMDYNDYIHCLFYDDSTLDENKNATMIVFADAYSESYSFYNNSNHVINEQNLTLAEEIWSHYGLERELLFESFYENNSLTTGMNPCSSIPQHTLYEDYVEVTIVVGNVADPSWWSNNWEHRKLITINHTQVDADLTSFPVLISLSSDSNLSDHAQADGDDITFVLYSDNSTQLNHEIESYDGEGNLTAWVSIPYLSSSSDTKIWMYYGNPPCDSQENISGTWDTDYVMVQHLQETTGTHYDSTLYGNNGTQYGGVTQDAAGKIDGADEFDGVDDYVNVSDDDSLDSTDITISAWVNPVTAGESNYGRMISKFSGSSNGWDFFLGNGGSNKLGLKINNNNLWSESGSIVGGWHHVTVTYETGIGAKFYVDGLAAGDDSGYTSAITSNNNSVHIGKWVSSSSRFFNGTIDEIRVSNSVRNISWINTSYMNQFDPSAFYDVGSEEDINLVPSAGFVYEPTSPTTADIIYFNSTSFDPDGNIVNWTWDFGDTNIAYGEFVTHQYSDNDTYTVNLTVRDDNGVIDSVEHVITVSNKAPVANFTYEPLEPAISDVVYFNSTSIDTDGYIVNWTWNFDDGNFSYTENTTHQYSSNGSYMVRLTVRDDDDATNYTEQIVDVGNEPPVANFTYEPPDPSNSDVIFFNSTSIDTDGYIVNWTWNFDDGNFSYTENTTHQYSNNGTYTVRLTVEDDDNATDFFEQTIRVGNQLPNASFAFEPADPTTADTIFFNSTSTDSDGIIVNWTWDFGDGNFSYTENTTYQYGDNGSYLVRLTVKDNESATNYTEQIVDVSNVPPIASFTYEPPDPLTTDTIYFNSTSLDTDGYIVNWTWDFDDGYFAFTENVTHQYGYNGAYAVTLTVIDDDGENANISKVVQVGIEIHIITNLSDNWNFVSSPFNQSVNLSSLIIKYSGVNYTWAEAIDPVNGPIVDPNIYGWNRTLHMYFQASDALEPGYGYWIYAYFDCELRVENLSATPDNYITDLELTWNAIGAPCNQPVNIADLIVHYDGADYNWTEATSIPIVDPNVYGWNRTLHMYVPATTLEPGYAYWMYAYYNCTLRSE